MDTLAFLPWLLLMLLAAPVLVSAYFLGIYPTRRLLWPFIIPLGVAVASIWADHLMFVVWLLDALFAAIACIDLFLFLVSQDLRNLVVSREIPQTASLGAANVVQLHLENHSLNQTLSGWVRDDLPPDATVTPDEQAFELPPSSRLTLQYRLTPMKRGLMSFETVYFKQSSLLGLWNRYTRRTNKNTISVYPDIRQLTEYALLARTDRLSLIGVRRTRKIGQDNEFERLRDYTRDDNYRHIDWRSTARRNRLTVRQYQADQSQRLLIMLDCGRMMTNQYQGLSLLDYALNASLMLAHVALRQGDAVGMLCFSDRVHKYVPPRSGSNQTNRMLHAAYDQFPQMVESRYDQAFLYLSNHCRRRSLVVLFTNVIDDVNADQIHNYLGNLAGKHLPLAVSLRDRQIFEFADNPADAGPQLYRSAAAAEVLCWRNQVLTRLRHRGALVVDTFPDQISAPLVNQYLEIKAKHML